MRTPLFLLALCCSGCLDWDALSPSVDAGPMPPSYEGFGAVTKGGEGKQVVHVTTLADSGPGSLREALSQSDRTVVFDVAGTITLGSELLLRGRSFLTIDGSSAPAPGITLEGGGLSLEDGTHDVIVKHLRVRGSSDDAVRVYNASRVIIDHVSIANAGSGSLDITESSFDVTVQWCVLRKTGDTNAAGNMLVSYGARRVTLHHNLYAGTYANPLLSEAPSSGDVVADVRNNLVWSWGASGGTQFGFGTGIDRGARANVVANFYEARGSYPSLAQLAIDLNRNGPGSRVYARDNVSGNGATLYGGNESEPFDAPPLTLETACAAARRVLAEAGAQPRDSVDEQLVGQIDLTGCP